MKMSCRIVLLFLVMLNGCREENVTTSMQPETATEISIVGLLPETEHQHPLVVGTLIGEGVQGYLDLVEGGKRTRQIILVYPNNMARPEDGDRLIEITGKPHIFEPSQPTQVLHKRHSGREVVEVYNWKYKE